MNPGFRCPNCREPLIEHPSEYVCDRGHHFDRAKEGYVNLLPGGRLKGRPAGDDDAMVRARRTVFDAGLYRPIIDAVADTARERTVGTPTPAILDCGCGEGAYLARASAVAGGSGWGVDISKAAVRTAARRHRDLHLAVASSYALPFDDGLFDVAISVFSPRPYAEMVRVLSDGGSAIVVRPGPDHLAELKALIYADPRQHRDPQVADDPDDADNDDAEGWPSKPSAVRVVGYTLDLGDAALRLALLEMTPFWWSATAAHRAAVAERARSVTVDMRLAVFRSPDGSADDL